MAHQQHRGWGFAACALASAFWGTGFFLGKIVLREMAPPFMVLFRFLFATLALLPFLLQHRPRFSPREWRLLSIAAFFGVPLQFLLQFRGLSLTTVSHASLMVGTMPVLLALGATLFANERLDAIGWFAMAASTAGAVLIALSGNHAGASAAGSAPVRGDAMIVVSLAISLFWMLLNKSLVEHHDHRTVSAWGITCGTAMLLAWVLLADGPPPIHHLSPATWAAAAASGLLCTAATTLLWNWGMTQVPASQAGVLLNIEPLMGSLLGITLLGERLGPAAWAGGAMILAAAVILTSRPHAAPDTEVAGTL